MSSSNLNMYAGAFLGTVFVMMKVSILGEAIFHSETPEQEGFAIAVSEGGGGTVGRAVFVVRDSWFGVKNTVDR